jgi:acyl-CoA synthetase (AMP-forming)/AMP-acid ligase II
LSISLLLEMAVPGDPDRIVFRDHLPTTPTGKGLRRRDRRRLKLATAEQ